MKLWGLRKNLASDAWRHVDRTIQKRCAAGKRSLVILSGRRLPAQTVQNKTKRHKLVTWNRRKCGPRCGSNFTYAIRILVNLLLLPFVYNLIREYILSRESRSLR